MVANDCPIAAHACQPTRGLHSLHWEALLILVPSPLAPTDFAHTPLQPHSFTRRSLPKPLPVMFRVPITGLALLAAWLALVAASNTHYYKPDLHSKRGPRRVHTRKLLFDANINKVSRFCKQPNLTNIHAMLRWI